MLTTFKKMKNFQTEPYIYQDLPGLIISALLCDFRISGRGRPDTPGFTGIVPSKAEQGLFESG